MIIRGIDENGDWIFGQGLNSYKSTQQAIEQNIKTKVLEWKGDCFFNLEVGIDWINFLGSNLIDELELALKNLIIACYGVVNVTQVSVEFLDRNFSVNYTIDTIYSQNVQNIINS